MPLEYITDVVSVLGILAFITSAIVQSIKEQPFCKDCPTSLIALVVAEIVTVVALIAYCGQTGTPLQWYYVTAAVVCGFIVYLIATGGWEKITDIWKKTQYKEGKEHED